MLTRLTNAVLHDRARQAGLAVGAAAALLSLIYEVLFPGRLLGDPLPLYLALAGVRQIFVSGFLYFDWLSPLLHILFSGALGLLAVQALRLSGPDVLNEASARRAAWTASALNVGIAAILEVDSLTVAIFYVITGWLSVSIAAFVAGRAAVRFSGNPRPTG